MIGGIIEAIATQDRLLRITVLGTGWQSSQICALSLKQQLGTQYLQPGDYIWWQERTAYWTPLKANQLGLNFILQQWNICPWNHTLEDYPFFDLSPFVCSPL